MELLEKTDPINDKDTFSSGDLAINWEDRTIAAGETQVIRYSIGYGPYVFGYLFDVKANFTKSYEPNTDMDINISIDETHFGEQIKITRQIDDGSTSTIYNSIDNGKEFLHTDFLHLPTKIGWHKIKYSVSNNESIVNENPKISKK